MPAPPTPPAASPVAEPADPRRHSAAADRNKGPILTELLRRLPPQGRALEIASGTGQHVVHFAAAMPGWQWQPSDAEPGALASIEARRGDAALPNVAAPLAFDLLADEPPWPKTPVDLVFAANLLHISPWATCAALVRGAARCLSPGGLLVTYGPYRVPGEALRPGNEAFDADLRRRNPAWGLRGLDEVQACAGTAGLVLRERIVMPADNLMLVFARAEHGPVHRVRLEPHGQGFDASSQRSVLASALAAGLEPPRSCRNGQCRACLCRLREGEVAYTIEWPGLSAEEKATGWTLPCVALPRSDLVIEVRSDWAPGTRPA